MNFFLCVLTKPFGVEYCSGMCSSSWGCYGWGQTWKKFPLTEFESNFINLALDTKTPVSPLNFITFGLVEKLLRVEMPSQANSMGGVKIVFFIQVSRILPRSGSTTKLYKQKKDLSSAWLNKQLGYVSRGENLMNTQNTENSRISTDHFGWRKPTDFCSLLTYLVPPPANSWAPYQVFRKKGLKNVGVVGTLGSNGK